MEETGIVPRRNHVETASATTDPDNANSGNFAYILTAVVLVGLVALCVALSGVVGALAGQVLESRGTDSLEGLVDQYDGTGQDGTGRTSGELSLSDALDLDLAPYSLAVNDGVSATAYAGVPDDVRSYVRSVLSADGDAQQEVARQLNAAARSDDPASGMQAVVDAANSGKAAIEGLALPTLSDADVSSELAAARQATLDRWDAVIAEVGVLSAGSDADGTVSRTDLTKADDDVREKTEEAAEDFTQALQAAARQ